MSNSHKSKLSREDIKKFLAAPRSVVSKKGRKPARQHDKDNEKDKDKDKDKDNHEHNTEQQKEDEVKVQYRDRAAERRKGKAGDYKEAEELVNALGQRELTSEEQKYLGGDVSHTHLVKGLDFALLQQMREKQSLETAVSLEEEQRRKEEEEAMQYLERIHGGQESKPTFRTKLASDIYTIALTKPTIPKTNELFRPGRMVYTFDLGFDHSGNYVGSDELPTIVLRSRNEEDATGIKQGDEVVIEKVCRIFENMRKNTAKKSEASKGNAGKDDVAVKVKEKVKAAPPKQQQETTPTTTMDDEDDIFGDVGRDYEVTITKKKTQKQENETSTKVHLFASESFDMDERIPLPQQSVTLNAMQRKAVNNDIVRDVEEQPRKRPRLLEELEDDMKE